MKPPKIRKEKLTIYLIKASTSGDRTKILNIEGAKDPIQMNVEGIVVTLYVKKEPPKPPPPWTKLFTDHQNLPDDLFGSRKSVGAALLIYLEKKAFVLTFGSGHHLLKNEAIERDFGLRVTLNSVDPDKLRSLDKASYVHNPLNSRTQSSIDLGVFDLDVDSDMDMLYALTGASKVPIFGTHVTGRDALTIAVEVNLSGIKPILSEAANRYERDLPKEFEWVDNIQRVKDKDLIEVLDLELDDLLAKNDYSNMWLGEPEIIDWESQIGYSFDLYPNTPRHVVLMISDLVQYFNERSLSLTSENLKSQIIHINDSEYNSTRKWSAYRCLYAEMIVGQERYILRNGLWYKVDAVFAEEIEKSIKKLDVYSVDLPIYNHSREEDYNELVSKSNEQIELMDKSFVKIGGPYDKLEFCDLIIDKVNFVHVKYYRSSATLSHLFAQGFVAAEAFVGDAGFRRKLNEKLPDSCKLTSPNDRPDPANYRIVYAIATSKSLPEELPFFSKVTLKNALKTLRMLNYNVSLITILVDPSLELVKKCKPKKAKA